MPKLPDVSGKEARRALERLGFVFKRQSGSHAILRRGNRGCVVPMHREINVAHSKAFWNRQE
jgi:predicted RNA binding protein YcfA (HicA-like mRNA interferase family)